MNLTNKNITVISLAVSTFPPETRVKVEVTQKLTDTIYKTLGVYELLIPQVFMGPEEAGLLAEIHSQLSELPE